MKINRSTSKLLQGFTMIELLVVMGIITILAGMSIFALQGARKSARDARRKGDLEIIATALEFYRSDCHEYPDWADLVEGDPLESDAACPAGINTYLETIPGDPLTGNYAYRRIGADGVRYTLCSTLEDPPSPPLAPANCDLCAGGACEYRVTNP